MCLVSQMLYRNSKALYMSCALWALLDITMFVSEPRDALKLSRDKSDGGFL